MNVKEAVPIKQEENEDNNDDERREEKGKLIQQIKWERKDEGDGASAAQQMGFEFVPIKQEKDDNDEAAERMEIVKMEVAKTEANEGTGEEEEGGGPELVNELQDGLIVTQYEYRCCWSNLEQEFAAVVGQLLRDKMSRHKQKLPVVVKLPIWSSTHFHLLNFWYGDLLILPDKHALEAFLGGKARRRKDFPRGSYGMMAPPLKILFKSKTEEISIHLHYYVKNEARTLQWPLEFITK